MSFHQPLPENLDDRFHYPEKRWYTIGLVHGRPITLIYKEFNNYNRRIISVWKAEKHEQATEFNSFSGPD